jgi:hypothetical protein
MTALLDHLGVALLGHIEFGKEDLPQAHRSTWKTYANNKRLFPDLCRKAKLQDFLSDSETHVTSSFIGNATLVALGHIYGYVSLPDAIHILQTPSKLERLYRQLQGRMRIKRK